MSGRKPPSSTRAPGEQSKNGTGGARHSPSPASPARVAELGKEISRAYKGRRLDVVITLDRGFVFAADLIRELKGTVVCHFVREDVRDVEESGRPRREVLFGSAAGS